ncbi:interferon a3-like isoform X2 [Anabas testudineus]|uniref:interferon a3-like isoform X2 n=1 Tax=Anabas testudineus TaxID=64144 RepID=UPI000E45BBD8|nr:interferon a3-like isoform X2 [Anabas testudineus]
MLNRIFFLCLFVALHTSGSSLRCSWMDHKFRQCSERTLDLINSMVTVTDTVDDADADDVENNDTVHFPSELYKTVSNASAEHKLTFTVQILEEVSALFNHSSAPWHSITVEHFRIVVTRQAQGLRSCTRSHRHNTLHKKLHMYFNRLSGYLKRMDHSAAAWELIRKEIKTHLLRIDLLISSVLTANN